MTERLLVVLGALFGLVGVAAAAAAAHITGGSLTVAADFLLFHAPVLIAAALAIRSGLVAPKLARLGAMLIFLGVVLFSGDLALRASLGTPLFHMAAPTGGIVLMIGWVLLGVAGAIGSRRADA